VDLGLHAAAVLAAIEERINARIATRFDLIAGTSVGGIIALGVANEVPAAKIKKAFEDDGTDIFSARRAPQNSLGKILDVLRSVIGPKYDSAALRKTIIDIVGAEITIGSLKHPCIIPTVSLTKGGPQIFKTDHHSDFGSDHRLKAVDVAMATSAAPTHFPIAEIGDGLYADGGLYADSPDLIAVHEVERFLTLPLLIFASSASERQLPDFHSRTIQEPNLAFSNGPWGNGSCRRRSRPSSRSFTTSCSIGLGRVTCASMQSNHANNKGRSASIQRMKTLKRLSELWPKSPLRQLSSTQTLRRFSPTFHRRQDFFTVQHFKRFDFSQGHRIVSLFQFERHREADSSSAHHAKRRAGRRATGALETTCRASRG
jgi:predicted acylesterase/phospholipase RssA